MSDRVQKSLCEFQRMKQDEVVFSQLRTVPRVAWSGPQICVPEVALAFCMEQGTEVCISFCLR